jgi:endogenous inhibitor of DNA gyrase (YacG/DUF329 family)
MKKTTELSCPTCQKTVYWNEEFPYRPFCSQRCQLIDLGEWANESYSIPVSDENQEKDNWDQ